MQSSYWLTRVLLHRQFLLQASREAIHAVASALSTTLDLASVFKGLSKGALYNMRTIVCYFGHHYQVRPTSLFVPVVLHTVQLCRVQTFSRDLHNVALPGLLE